MYTCIYLYIYKYTYTHAEFERMERFHREISFRRFVLFCAPADGDSVGDFVGDTVGDVVGDSVGDSEGAKCRGNIGG
jgi:hypothetical protein